MNSVVLSGHLTRDITVTMSQSGISIARFSIGVNRESKDNQSDFPSCIAFSKTADYLSAYGTKGRLVELKGRIQTGSYTDRDGRKVYTTDVIVDRAQFLDRKEEKKTETEPEASEPEYVPEADINNDDLPF